MYICIYPRHVSLWDVSHVALCRPVSPRSAVRVLQVLRVPLGLVHSCLRLRGVEKEAGSLHRDGKEPVLKLMRMQSVTLELRFGQPTA